MRGRLLDSAEERIEHVTERQMDGVLFVGVTTIVTVFGSELACSGPMRMHDKRNTKSITEAKDGRWRGKNTPDKK